MSARLPGSIEPSAPSQVSMRAGFVVAIATSSRGVNTPPRASDTSHATFNSASRFFEPDGDQSEPSAIGSSSARARAMSAVPP